MPPMDEPQRIAVETEAGWLRIRENVEKGMMASMELRLASLPGGRDGETSRRVRKEIEARMAKVRQSSRRAGRKLTTRYRSRCGVWRRTICE